MPGLACCSSPHAAKKDTRHARSGPMAPPAFWVWHRTSPLDAGGNGLAQTGGCEPLVLAGGGVRVGWRWHVTRIAAPMMGTRGDGNHSGVPDQAGARVSRIAGCGAIPSRMKSANGRTSISPREIQFDFDCPDRLLDGYTRFPEILRKSDFTDAVSITALAAWPRHPEFRTTSQTPSSSLAPMFYDLTADDPADVKAGRFQPMADPSVPRSHPVVVEVPAAMAGGLAELRAACRYSKPTAN